MRAEPGPVEVIPLSRRWLWLVAAVALALSFGSSPGQISPDTKLDLTANPLRFLARATNLWNSELPFGQAQNQAYGYLFPHGTFFLAGHLLGLPGWITQRLWWALLLTVGFWGLLRVAEALGIGSPTSRAVAAAAFALSPRVLTTIGSISSETLPIMLAPWVLLPTILALRDSAPSGPSVRRLAGQAGVAVALMGAVNAIATLAGCLPAVIWWACHRPNRRWLRYAAWWLLALALAMTWWLVALILMARISPPFLDFIESSGVTTQWSSLVEVLRGTDSWTPFVAPNATAGAPLVTGSVAILATCLVAAAGLAGLAGMSAGNVPASGRLVTMLLVGVVLLGVGYSGGLGSPVAQHVQAFLDAGGAPLRNVHKFESLIRIPVVLGLAQLLGRIPLPGSAPKPLWRSAFAHPERDKRVAVGIVVLTALMAGTSLAWTGRMTPPGTYSAIPRYWHDAADWLSAHNTGVPTPGRVLVVPGAPFATQLWGTSHDEPLQVLGDSPWGVRDSIPLTPPQTIRALDSVQRLFASGTPSAGLADTLARQGISYVVMRNDLDPDASRSARPILVHRAVTGSPRLQKVAEFGPPVGPGPVSGFVTDSELRPRYPAVEIYRVTAVAGDPGAPYLADIDGLPRVDGGPEALLRLDERRRLSGRPPLGPALLTADAVGAGLPVPVVTVTDTPLARETDYGRVDDHSSAIRAVGDTRHTFNRVPDYPSPGADTVYGSWTGGRLTASSSSSDSTVLPDVATAASPAAAIDADSATAWVSNSLQSAVGQWLQVDFDHPVTNSIITITPSATTVGAQVRRVEVETATGTTTLRFDEAGKPISGALPYGETPWVRITAIGTDDGSPGVQFAITDLSITQYDARGFAHPINIRHTALVPAPPPNAAVAQWDLGSDPLGRPGCATGLTNVQCAPSMALATETPATFSRTLSVPQPMSVLPTIWVRARSGPKLADLVAEPDTTRAHGDSDLVDVLGAASAATDGDPATAWTAPQRVVQHKTPPTLTLTLPQPTEVTGLRVAPSTSPVPAHPTMVAVDLGDGPQVRTLKTSGPQDLPLHAPDDRHHHGQPARLERRHRPHRTRLRPTQATGAGRDRGAGHRRQTDRRRRRGAQPDSRGHRRLRARTCHRDRRPLCAHFGQHHGRRAAGRRSGNRAALRRRADHVADWRAGAIGKSRATIRRRRRGVVRTARGPVGHRPGDAGGHRSVGSGPSRSAGAGRDGVAGAGRAGKYQPRLGGAHQRWNSVDTVGGQRMAAGMGGAGRNVGHHHADLRAQLAVPGRPGRRAGAAAAVGAAGVVAAATPAERFRCAPVDARALGRRRDADRRRG